MWIATAQRVLGNSAGTMNGDGSRKILLHSTEGGTAEGAIAAYRQHNSWPHLTVDIPRRRIIQHVPLDEASRSLRNAAGGVETNRDGTYLVQIELVGFAERPHTIATDAGLEWFGREVIAPIHNRTGVPIVSTVKWLAYPQSYGPSKVRLTTAAWDAYSGVLGHQHAPENSHGDPGAIDIDRILAAAGGEEPVTEAEMDRIADKVVAKLEKRMGTARTPIRQELRELAKLGADDALDARETDAPDASPTG